MEIHVLAEFIARIYNLVSFFLLLLLKMFREGIPSAVAGFQGALLLHTKIPLKNPENLITITL